MSFSKDMLSFEKIEINHDMLGEVWSLNPSELDHIDGVKLSSYAVALAQYLIYFTFQRNKARAEHHKLSKYVERTVSLIMISDETLKKIKSKSSITDYVISTNESLMESQTRLDEIDQELLYIEGIDKSIGELIATLKRELTRRENELYAVRMERK